MIKVYFCFIFCTKCEAKGFNYSTVYTMILCLLGKTGFITFRIMLPCLLHVIDLGRSSSDELQTATKLYFVVNVTFQIDCIQAERAITL